MRGEIVWRTSGTGKKAESRAEVPRGLHIRVTGRDHCTGRTRWLEVDRVWAPGLPPPLLEQNCWIREKDEEGTLLAPVDLLATPAKPREPSDEAEFFLLGSWDDWREFVALTPLVP